MGKPRVIAETGAGQHGVASATDGGQTLAAARRLRKRRKQHLCIRVQRPRKGRRRGRFGGRYTEPAIRRIATTQRLRPGRRPAPA